MYAYLYNGHSDELPVWTLNEMNLNFSSVVNYKALRVQVPNNHIPTPNLYYSYYYPKPKYLIIGYLDPLGRGISSKDKGIFSRRPKIQVPTFGFRL